MTSWETALLVFVLVALFLAIIVFVEIVHRRSNAKPRNATGQPAAPIMGGDTDVRQKDHDSARDSVAGDSSWGGGGDGGGGGGGK